MLAESSRESPLKVNLVLEGGGVKGIALVGAIAALEEEFERRRVEEGQHWALGRLVGTSAGAIVAALLGAGYSSKELSEIIAGEEIRRFADLSGIARIPLIGRPFDMGLGLLLRLGMFKGDYFLGFIRELLQAKGIRTFGDLISDGYKPEGDDTANKYRVRMIASDITRGRMLLLPDDMNVQQYGVTPDNLEVAEAVRMSISVPFVFRPVTLVGLNGAKSYIVDGGLLSNFPVGIFDSADSSKGKVTTIGIKLVRARYHKIKFPFLAARAAYALGSTALEAHDTSATEKFDRVKSNQTVNINTEAVSILRFDLPPLLREVLYSQGYSEMKNVVVRTEFLDRAVEAMDAAMMAQVAAAR